MIDLLIWFVNTFVGAVISNQVATSPSPFPSPTSEPTSLEENTQPLKDPSIVKVTRIIDGDTIEIESGQKVRYIGIDTPETVDPNRPAGCYGQEASNKNKELVEGKEVYLEKDVSETDRYGRLLRYVWVGDQMINKLLVKDGYAQASSYPPDIKHQEELSAMQASARENKLGLWGEVCNPTPTPTLRPTAAPVITPKPTIKPSTTYYTPPPVNNPTSDSYTCNCSKTCSQIASCAEAQYLLKTCGCSARDGDKDGVACDGKPLNCQNFKI